MSNPKSVSRYVRELGHNVRSRPEEQFCRLLVKENIEYLYEPERFDIITSEGYHRTYLPDIYLPNTNIYIEIKGRFRPTDIKKQKAFISQYPNETLIMGGGHDQNNCYTERYEWEDREKCIEHLKIKELKEMIRELKENNQG